MRQNRGGALFRQRAIQPTTQYRGFAARRFYPGMSSCSEALWSWHGSFAKADVVDELKRVLSETQRRRRHAQSRLPVAHPRLSSRCATPAHNLKSQNRCTDRSRRLALRPSRRAADRPTAWRLRATGRWAKSRSISPIPPIAQIVGGAMGDTVLDVSALLRGLRCRRSTLRATSSAWSRLRRPDLRTGAARRPAGTPLLCLCGQGTPESNEFSPTVIGGAARTE